MPKQAVVRDERRWALVERLFVIKFDGSLVPAEREEREKRKLYRELEKLEKKKKPPAH